MLIASGLVALIIDYVTPCEAGDDEGLWTILHLILSCIWMEKGRFSLFLWLLKQASKSCGWRKSALISQAVVCVGGGDQIFSVTLSSYSWHWWMCDLAGSKPLTLPEYCIVLSCITLLHIYSLYNSLACNCSMNTNLHTPTLYTNKAYM